MKVRKTRYGHSAGRDHPEVGQSPVVRRPESEEAQGRGDRADEDGAADTAGRRHQRAGNGHQSRAYRFLITQREVNGEVDAETEEHHQEHDGQRVVLPDRDHREGGRPHDPHGEHGECGQNDPDRPHPHDQNQHQQDDGQQTRNLQAANGCLDLLVRERYLSRDTDPHFRRRAGCRNDFAQIAHRFRIRRGLSDIEVALEQYEPVVGLVLPEELVCPVDRGVVASDDGNG